MLESVKELNEETDSPWKNLAAKALKDLESIGIPGTKNEEWKYTSLKPLSEINFKQYPAKKEFNPSELPISFKANKLVFINGYFSSEYSEWIDSGENLFLTHIKDDTVSDKVIQHLGKYAKTEGQGLNAMNTAAMSNGAFVFIPARMQLKNPVCIVHVSISDEVPLMSQPRNLVVLEESASATVVEYYISNASTSFFNNIINEIYVSEGASLDHYKIQQESGDSWQNNFTQIFQEKSTKVNQVTLTLDGKLVRNNLHTFMNGEQSECHLYGLYLTSGNTHVDNHTRVDHGKPNCFSNEKYKGILKDKSSAVFNGKIIVHENAVKTNAYQRNQNILLSEEATVNTKPQLEIFADDVKCTHGATVGSLDEEPLFYMRSRGIPEQEARRMLLNAYADEIAELIKIPELVQIMEDEIERKLS